MKKAIMISIQPQWVEKILNGEKTIEIRKTKPSCDLPVKVYIYCSGGNGKKVDVFQRWNDIRLIKRKVDKGWLKDKPEKTTQILIDYGRTHQIHKDNYELNGRIVAEFTLNKVYTFDFAYSEWAYNVAPAGSKMPMSEETFIRLANTKGCLTNEDLIKYFGDEDYVANLWHITDLKTYDKPKELSHFETAYERWKKPNIGGWFSKITVECPYCKKTAEVYNTSGSWCCCGGTMSVKETFKPKKKILTKAPQSWCYVEEVEGESL